MYVLLYAIQSTPPINTYEIKILRIIYDPVNENAVWRIRSNIELKHIFRYNSSHGNTAKDSERSQNINTKILAGTTVENKGKLILTTEYKVRGFQQ